MRSSSRDIISVERYNAIRTLDEQALEVDSSVLKSLARLFIKHQSHKDFGISLLHRHQILSSGESMLHTSDHLSRDICQRKKLEGTDEAYPSAFYVNQQGTLEAFEYSQVMTPKLDDTFVAELAAYILRCNLESTLALSALSPLDPPRIESLLPHNQGTVATPIDEELEAGYPGLIVTEWGFIKEHDNEMRIRRMKACKQDQSGGHKVETIRPNSSLGGASPNHGDHQYDHARQDSPPFITAWPF